MNGGGTVSRGREREGDNRRSSLSSPAGLKPLLNNLCRRGSGPPPSSPPGRVGGHGLLNGGPLRPRPPGHVEGGVAHSVAAPRGPAPQDMLREAWPAQWRPLEAPPLEHVEGGVACSAAAARGPAPPGHVEGGVASTKHKIFNTFFF